MRGVQALRTMFLSNTHIHTTVYAVTLSVRQHPDSGANSDDGEVYLRMMAFAGSVLRRRHASPAGTPRRRQTTQTLPT